MTLQHRSSSVRSPGTNARPVRAGQRKWQRSTVVACRAYGVVLTGGSKGLGYAMAREFLINGDELLLCGRNAQRLQAAVSSLRQEFPQGQVDSIRCDVSSPADMDALAAKARNTLGTVHLWINNAGEVTSKKLLSDLSAEEITRVVGSNVTGSLLGCRSAIQLMREQPGAAAPQYHVFNMGFSSWGASFSRSACTHKSTKTALTQLTISLAEELKAEGLTSIGVHNLSPGMVLTDLLLAGASPVARRFFNTLAEEPEVVAAALVPRIRSVQGSGTSIDFLNPATAVGRVVTGVPQIVFGGRFFDKEGNRVAAAGGSEAAFKSNGVRLMFEYDPEDY